MYAVGVRDRGELAVIITMGEAKPDQMNLLPESVQHHVRSGRIGHDQGLRIRGRGAPVHAGAGNEPAEARSVPAEGAGCQHLKHDHMGDHLLQSRMRGNLEDVDSLLMQSIRQTDEAGMLTDDGVYLLMSQAGEKELPIILKRLTRSGLHCFTFRRPKRMPCFRSPIAYRASRRWGES